MKLFPHISTRRGNKFSSSGEIAPEDVFLDSQNLSQLNIQQMEGHLEQPLGRHIFYIFSIVLLILIGGFGYRLFAMQITQASSYIEKADRNHLRSTPIFSLRGTISDRNGNLLAWNEAPATSTLEIPKRVYTTLGGFSHILGYVSYPKKDTSGIFWQQEYIGKDGVEKQYQAELQGMPGEKVIGVNAKHEIEIENITIDPIHGENITLTIDRDVQAKLYERMEALADRVGFVAGAGVIMDVHTGEILALTSFPEYNNNLITNSFTPEENNKVVAELQSPQKKFLNRAVSGLFTPGSTVKPFIAYAALVENIITPEKQILSTGALTIKNKYGGPDTVFKDWKAHGLTNMQKAIAESSDEYFYQIGGGYESQKGLGIAKIDKYSKMFGFDTLTGIDLPGEVSGNIPTPEWKLKVFNEEWLLGNTYHTSIGQYGFQLSPLELVRAVAAIANGGKLVVPHVKKDVVPTSVDLNLDQKDLDVIRDGMRHAVLDSTVKALDIYGVEVAGKSGTAELGVKKDLVNSWISGYFPYENPKYAFVVIMEKGSVHNLQGAVFAMRETLEWMRDNTNYTK